LYMQISRGDWQIHLSEHNGDCSPGSALRLKMDDVESYQQALLAKQYKFARPGSPEPGPMGKELSIGDPFGNRLTFYSVD
ncbi:MAG: glyoxalase superfamily protein, partial [Pseudomonadota bacterium]